MNTPVAATRRSPWIRRSVLALALVGLLVGGAVRFLGGGATPVPPLVPLEGVDPDCIEAITAAREKVLEEPRSAEAWGFFGKVLLANEQGRAADICLRQAEKLDGTEPRWPYFRGIANFLSDPPEAIACFRRAIACGDRPDSDPLSPRMQLATLLLQKGHDGEAETELKIVRALEPSNPRTIYLSALLLANRNDLRGSVIQLMRLTDQPATRRKASARLAQLYLRLGDAAAAKKWEKVAASLPEDTTWPETYTDELVKFKVGREQRFEEATHLQEQQRYGEAVALLQSMIEGKERAVSRAYVELGNAQAHLHRLPEAEEAYRQALRLSPEDAETHTRLALVYCLRGEERTKQFGDREGVRGHYRQALESVRTAVRINPQLGVARLTLGQILLDLGEREEGIAALRESLASRPESSSTHLLLGKALAQDGRSDEARRHLQAAVRFADENDGRPKEALEQFEKKQKAKPAGP